jgi:hypothetical protein
MESLQQNFKELKRRLKSGRGMDHAGDDPVFYLVFHPGEMLTVKRLTRQWVAQLELDGWKVHLFSMKDAVHQILQNDGLRDIWLTSEAEAPLDFEPINKTLADALTQKKALDVMLESTIKELAAEKGALLFVIDLEALHPYLRVGSIEHRLQGRFLVPTVILYPGIRSGRTSLRFLGIYPEDGNYRSMHIGG